METSYSPVQYVYKEIVEEEILKQTVGKLFYFSADNKVEDVQGRIVKMEEIPGKGLFVVMESDARVRMDRIITVFGKPFAAFDEYDAYANACLSCRAGYDFD